MEYFHYTSPYYGCCFHLCMKCKLALITTKHLHIYRSNEKLKTGRWGRDWLSRCPCRDCGLAVHHAFEVVFPRLCLTRQYMRFPALLPLVGKYHFEQLVAVCFCAAVAEKQLVCPSLCVVMIPSGLRGGGHFVLFCHLITPFCGREKGISRNRKIPLCCRLFCFTARARRPAPFSLPDTPALWYAHTPVDKRDSFPFSLPRQAVSVHF